MLLRLKYCFKIFLDGTAVDVLFLHPRWSISALDPIRGAALDYRTLKVDQVPWTMLFELLPNGFSFFGLVNAVEVRAQRIIRYAVLNLMKAVSYIKDSIEEELSPSICYLVMRGKETSLVDKKEKSSKNQIRQNSGVDLILESHRERNKRVQHLHEVNIAEVSKNVIKIQIFESCGIY
eukprot:snap_masked-scaffold_64-processed-gene-0.44-mRNA-1 protein AED:1.00 eAED:1.00 QI:0/-1/0/0/-1/1/1/0/177